MACDITMCLIVAGPSAQCSVPDAMQNCRHDWMREALRILVARRGWELPPALVLQHAPSPPLLSNGNGSAALTAAVPPEPAIAAGSARVYAQS